MNLNKDYGVARRRINFTSGGSDENDEMNALRLAEIVRNELCGHFTIYLGDDSAFHAIKSVA